MAWGARPAGEVASALAIKAISESMESSGPDSGTVTGIEVLEIVSWLRLPPPQDCVSAHVLETMDAKAWAVPQ